MRITARVLVVVVLTAVGIVLLDTLVTRWAFQQRFLAYVNEQERETLDVLAESLAEQYQRAGSWAALGERRLLFTILAASRHHVRTQIEAREQLPLRPRLPPLGRRLTVRDAQGRVILRPGAPPERHAEPHTARPIEPRTRELRAGGRLIGHLELLPARSLVRDADRRFAQEHMRMLWWIAGAAALIALVVGMLLARHLVAPVKRLTSGARALAAGRYATRLSVERRDELGELARDFNALAAALERNRDARQRWLADISHELRTPLSVLRGELEALQDGIRPLDRQALDSLSAEAERLGTLIDDLYELSLSDAGALDYTFQPLELGAVLEETVDAERIRFEDRGLHLEAELPAAPLPVYGDARRLAQLFRNLLGNSLRYTEPGQPVRLSARRLERGCEVCVDDGPPGVAAEDRARLFDRFYRVERSRSRDHGGAGLGLAICQQIAHAHGASMTAQASALGGLRVAVILPAHGPGAEPEAESEG